MFIFNLCYKLGEIVTTAVEGLVKSLHQTFHVHEYEAVTSIYYKENGEIRYHDTICRCKVCGHRETFRKEITKKKQLYQIYCRSNNDCNLNCLVVGTTMDEIKTRVSTYLERINNLQLLPFVGIAPVELIDGLKINVGEELFDEYEDEWW